MKSDEMVENELLEAEAQIKAVCARYGLTLTDSMGCHALELISTQEHPNGDLHVVSMAFDANDDCAGCDVTEEK
jgi:hypothetical protein